MERMTPKCRIRRELITINPQAHKEKKFHTYIQFQVVAPNFQM